MSKKYHCEDCCEPLNNGIPISVKFGRGHYLEEIEVNFCSDNCMLSYLRKEQKKNKYINNWTPEKDNRFIYGGA